MLKWLAAPLALALGAAPLAAQTETVLKEYFEGMTVSPKLAMPGTEDGIDVYPGSPRPVDYSQYASRLKRFGTAIKAGEPVTITKIKLKSKHIEFQLGGGGYGTFGEETSSSVPTAVAPKTKREQNLEADLTRETDPAKRRAIKEELDDLQAERERENARNRAAVAEAQEHRKQNIRQLRLEGGSRFNLHYTNEVRSEALTPQSVIAALAQYVDFGQLRASEPATSGWLHKGMLLQEADALLGPASTNSERKEGSLKVAERVYPSPNGRLTAWFVEGVLIRYTISSE
ncbi:MAG TPA: hypothetical protein VGN76_11835 [Gemmatimonadales bacterium]|jgi:hypothetical protein|nr:hypothetical protein [Gemmatimonadales bacterium]